MDETPSLWMRQHKTLQHIATHCNTLQHKAPRCTTLHNTATHCNTLQHTATYYKPWNTFLGRLSMSCAATHCIILQHTTTHCNTLQHTTHCNTLQHTATYYRLWNAILGRLSMSCAARVGRGCWGGREQDLRKIQRIQIQILTGRSIFQNFWKPICVGYLYSNCCNSTGDVDL